MLCEVSGRECPTLDEHHVIPREYGGVNGPTVKIDPALHQAIHRYVGRPTKLAKFLAGYPAEVRARVNVLVTAIKEAGTTLDRARACTITFNLPTDKYSQLSVLAKEASVTENALAKKLILKLLA